MAAVKNPSARKTEIVVQELKGELLIYDLQINKAYCLNETSARVYGLCDGSNSVAEISNELSSKLKQPITDELVWLAIDQLKQDNLLENSSDIETGFDGLSRREIIRQVGFASMVALPVISSLIAPTAARAQSGGCVQNTDCPPSNNPCQVSFCSAGVCTASPAPAGTSAGNGQICNGSGNAVQCITAFDCPGQDTPCQSRTCTAGVCGLAFAPANTPVGNGQICDGSGNAVSPP